MRLDLESAITLYKRLDSERKQWDTTWEELAYYMHPARVGFITQHARGEKKTERLFDSTGMTAVDDLSHYLAAVLTPAASPWFKLKTSNKALNQNQRAAQWLESCEQIQRTAMEQSNFHAQAIEYFKDVVTFGTAAFEAMEAQDIKGEFDGLTYSAPHMREMTGMSNPQGIVDLTIRSYKRTAKEWVQMFGNKAGPNVSNDRPTKEYVFIHVAWPRDPEQIDPAAFELKDVDEKKLPFGSMWINYTEKYLVKESGYYERPRTLARWDCNTDNLEGHGPGLRAIPDVRTLNEAVRLEFDAWEKMIDPPILSEEDNIQGDLLIAAGKQTVVRDINGTKPLYNGTQWQLQTVERERLEQHIRDVMFSDLIREPSANVGTKSQFEVAKRIERAQRILGQAVGRQRWEFLKWVVERSFSILYRNDAFPPMPEILQGENFEIQYTSPLAIAQQAQGLENVFGALQDLAMVANMRSPADPSQDPVWDWFDADGYIEEVFTRRNVPQAMVTSQAERTDARAQRADAQQAQQALAMAGQAADVAKTASEADPAALQLLQGGGG
jgi:hypothetical protein